MRNAFADELTRLAAQDPRVVLLSGDIGNRLFDKFKDQCPDRFFNCGVAEANMISMAAGLALCGLRPVTYTITPFTTARCYEQIKIDICYHNVPVIITAVGAGLAYASLGPTHHSLEDIGALRLLPNLVILCPGDAMEVRAAFRAALKHNGPVYLRLGKKKEPLIHKEVPDLQIGKALVLREGRDVCLLGTGNIMPNLLTAADQLAGRGISCEVVSVHTVKPLDEELLARAFKEFPLVTTVEEHSIMGGLGGSVAEWMVDHRVSTARMLRLGVRDEFMHEAGDQEYARKHFGLDPDAVADRIFEEYRKLK